MAVAVSEFGTIPGENYGTTPDEIREQIVKNVIIEACQDRDYQTLSAIFQVCEQWRGMADDILSKSIIATGLVPIDKPVEIYRTLAKHPISLTAVINEIKRLYGDFPEEWKTKQKHQQVRIIAMLIEYTLRGEKDSVKPPLNCLVRIINEFNHHKQFMSKELEVKEYQGFLEKTAHDWLYTQTPTNDPLVPIQEELRSQISIETESFYSKNFEIIKTDPEHPLSLFFFQRFYNKFNLPAIQQTMLVTSGSLRIDWVAQPCLTLKLHRPLTSDREKLFNDPTNLDPNQTFFNGDPHRYTSDHIAFMMAQTAFKTRRDLGDLATLLKEKLNVNICRLDNFIRACIQVNTNASNGSTFDSKEPLFVELLNFVREQSQFDRNQFVSNVVKILNRTDGFSAEVKKAIFKSIIPLIPGCNATFTQSQVLPEGESRTNVSYLTYVCQNEAVFGIETIHDLLAKKNSSFSPIPANELEVLLSTLTLKFLQEAICSNDQKLFDRNREVIHQLLRNAYEGSPEILESQKFLAMTWFMVPEKPTLEKKLKSVAPGDVLFTQDFESIRQQGIENVDPALWRLFSLADAPKIALWCTRWLIDARAFVSLYDAGKNASFPIQSSVAFAVLKELLKKPQHLVLNILCDVFSSWSYTIEDFNLLQAELKDVLEKRFFNPKLLTSFLKNEAIPINPVILNQFSQWGATLPVNAIQSLAPISVQDEVISILKGKFGCEKHQNLKRASQENKSVVSKNVRKKLTPNDEKINGIASNFSRKL